jgi:hypothetical protein
MLDAIKALENIPAPLPANEISAPALLESLKEHAAKTLVFRYEGADVQAGYHVTEVKSGRFQALDCGGQYENWYETFIQLGTFRKRTTAALCRCLNFSPSSTRLPWWCRLNRRPR